jgi:hypothetical protein
VALIESLMPPMATRRPSPRAAFATLAALVMVALTAAGSGCIEGGRISATIPPGLFSDVAPDVLTDGGEVAAPDTDVAPDLPDGADLPDSADLPDGAELPDTTELPDTGPDACVPGTPGCEVTNCTTSADCIALDDGNLCNGRFVCNEGNCEEDPTPVECPPDNSIQCNFNACDPASGECAKTPRPDGSLCTDLESCTAADHCLAGACIGGARVSCDDGDPCTDDTCDNGGCKHTPNTGPCDDGNACTKADTCAAGRCVGGQSVCECAGDADCAPFDDGDACNGVLTCVSGFCRAAAESAVVCPPSENPCVYNRCSPASGVCAEVPKPNGAGCNDANACTAADACQDGVCAGTPLACADGACTTGGCDPAAGCTQTPASDGQPCADVGGCLAGGTCSAGSCVPEPTACQCDGDGDCATFDDGDLCNGTFACVEGRCVLDPTTVVICQAPLGQPCKTAECTPATGQCKVANLPTGAPCSDGNACTSGDGCQAGVCTGAPTVCSGGSLCSDMVCNFFTGCKARPKGVVCAPSDVCTAAAGCAGGTCEDLFEVECPAGSECSDAACDPALGGCVQVALEGACDDADDCTAGDRCLGGQCKGAAKDCDDGNPCTLDTCGAAGECGHAPTSTAVCSDGNACTVGDVCTAGECVGTALAACGCSVDADCADFEDGDLCNGTLFCDGGTCRVKAGSVVTCDTTDDGPCVTNQCQPSTGTCAPSPHADGVACQSDDACFNDGACVAGACVGTAVNCDDGNPCTTDSCDAVLGCVREIKEGNCDDGNSCTASSSCDAGVCKGSTNTCTCSVDADCVSKEDGNACNGKLRCVSGVCEVNPQTVVKCTASANPCVSTACEPATGKCVETAKAGSCEDGNPCTSGDTCTNKLCVAGTQTACDGGGACATASCDPATGGCKLTPKTGACNDQNPCTSDDACVGGACVATANNCPCTLDEDCDDDITNKCLGTAVCGVGGCEVLAETGVDCSSPTDTPCAFLACDPADGTCAATTLPAGATCQPPGKCFQPGSCLANGTCNAQAVNCDDKNPCTADTCDPAIGCVHTPLAESATCDDGDACTLGTVCQSGKCAGGLNTCPCASQAVCDAKPIANPCNGKYSCTGGSCKLSGPVVCTPTGKEPCLTRSCNPGTGTCVVSQPPAGTPCNDSNACTSNDRCTADICIGTAKVCTDTNPCTDDTCDGGQCVNTVKNSGQCDDGDPCTANTTCETGVCGNGTFQCGCTSDANCKGFDDGNSCNGIWKCVDNICEPAPNSEVTCTDPNPFDCRDVACAPSTGACVETLRASGVACNDGSVCTTTDKCDATGGCAGTPTVTCSDPDPNDCESVACEPKLGACVATRKVDGAACSDHSACTTGDTCVAGSCNGTLIDCDDGKVCTLDSCSSTSGCSHVQAFGPCDDGDPCTGSTICVNSLCQNPVDICGCTVQADCDFLEAGDLCGGDWKCVTGKCKLDPATVVTCPAPTNPCMEASCSGGLCVETPVADNEPCSDGVACTKGDVCLAGACIAGKPACDDGNACTTDSCAASTGACTNTVKPDKTVCDDGNPCNGADSCQLGVCAAGAGSACNCSVDADCATHDDENLCNGSLQCVGGKCVINAQSVVVCPLSETGCAAQQCNPATGSCEMTLKPNDTGCNDGDPCTVADRCTAGACAGVPVKCDDSNPCTSDLCQPYFGCVHAAIAGPCDDGNPCTIGEVCKSGLCLGEVNTCDDGNTCTKDECLPSQGCRYLNEAASKLCDDGNVCTAGDRCGAGKCNPVSQLCGCTNVSQCTPNLCLGPVACISGQCIYDTAAKVTCPDDTDCSSYECVPATGECEVTLADDGEPCSDDDVCTTGDECFAGQCAATDSVSCQDDPSPCVQAVCDPVAGCQNQEVPASCDDSQACTIDDQCVAGLCLGVPAASPYDSFNTGDLSSWTFASTSDGVVWQLTGAHASSVPLALGVFDADSGSLADPAGPWTATATRAPADVPVGLPAGAAALRLALRMDVGATTCFRVLVDDALVHERCSATAGFIPVEVPLGDVGGLPVHVQFEVEETSATSTGTGVYVDDVVLDWGCLLK